MPTVTYVISKLGAGSMVLPSDVTSVTAKVWGGGGSGTGSSSTTAPGAGGGGFSSVTLTVTGGQTIFWNVGAGAINGTVAPGSTGGTSWFNPSANSQPSSNGAVATGGVGGAVSGTQAGGTGSVGTTNFTGGTSDQGHSAVGGGGGGGAGSAGNGGNASGQIAGVGGTPDGGAGGNGGTGNGRGVDGSYPGGGGGGGWSTGAQGANGANGQVIISFNSSLFFNSPILLTTAALVQFPVPAGVLSMTAEAWGAGGAGCGHSSTNGQGGSGGGYSEGVITTTPGSPIFCQVGYGGVGTQVVPSTLPAQQQTQPIASWVNPSANIQPAANGVVGGAGVGGDTTNSGGVGTIGTTNFTGGSSGNGSSGAGGGGGGGGAGSAGNGGNGGNASGVTPGAGGTGGSPDGGAGGAGNLNTNGAAGSQPGGGGGGGFNSPTLGGNGGDGQIRLTFSSSGATNIGQWNAPSAPTTVMSTELNSLANGSMAQSGSPYDNSSNLDLYADIEVSLAALSPTTGAYITLFIGESVDGVNFPSQSAADMRLTRPNQVLCEGSIGTTAATAQRLVFHGVPIPPAKFNVYLDNQTGAALAASGNTVKLTTYSINLN